MDGKRWAEVLLGCLLAICLSFAWWFASSYRRSQFATSRKMISRLRKAHFVARAQGLENHKHGKTPILRITVPRQRISIPKLERHRKRITCEITVSAHDSEVRGPICPGRFIAVSRALQLPTCDFSSPASSPPCMLAFLPCLTHSTNYR